MVRTLALKEMICKQENNIDFFLPESIHHIFYWQDCYHWLIYILQQRKYINNSWRRFEELLFSFFLQFGRAGPSEGLKIWRGAGASSNRRSYNGTGFASIFAKIWGGDTIAPLISDGPGGSLENKKKLALRLLQVSCWFQGISSKRLLDVIFWLEFLTASWAVLFVWNIRWLFVCFHPRDFFSMCWKHFLSG